MAEGEREAQRSLGAFFLSEAGRSNNSAEVGFCALQH